MEGGGDRKGMEGIVVGIVNVGIEGVLGNEGMVGMLLGSGGKVVGKDGRVGCGSVELNEITIGGKRKLAF